MLQILFKRILNRQQGAAWLAVSAMLVQLGFGLVNPCPQMHGGAYTSDASQGSHLLEHCTGFSDKSSAGFPEDHQPTCCAANCILNGVGSFAVLAQVSAIYAPKYVFHENASFPVLFVSQKYSSFLQPRAPPTLV